MSLKTKIIILSSIIFNLMHCVYAAALNPIENNTGIQNAVLFYINEYRQQHGLSKLAMNNDIVIQAKKHSLDMATHRMPFGHKDFAKRIAKLRGQIKNAGGGAENVAYNYNPQEVVKKWLLSPGHKKNIVGNYNLTGIGVVRDKQGRLYYTQIFLQTGTKSHQATRKPFIRSIPFFGIRSKG